MIWQYSPYTIPFLACGCITLILAVTVWRNRTYVCARPFTLLMLAATLWSFGAALEVSSGDSQMQMLAILFQYPGIVTVPIAWLLFAFEYSGREYWITTQNLLLLFIVPATSVVMVATNNIHHLFYSSVSEQVVGGLLYVDIAYGPFFWFNAIYSYLIIYIAIMLILQRFVFSAGLYRGQMVAILIAVLIPFFVNIAHAVRQVHFLVIDPTPLAFIISGVAVVVGMVKYQLLDIIPMAQDQVIANLHDGMMVVDLQGRVTSLTTSAEQLLGISQKTAVGQNAGSFIPVPESTRPDDPESLRKEQVQVMEKETNGRKHWLELRSNPILSRQDEVKGRIIMIRDITDQKLAEIALAQARKKISLLASITRHDILNQVTVLLLNIDELKDTVKDPHVRDLITVQESATDTIRRHIEFARDYESLGGRAPKWMSVKEIFTNLMPVTGTYGISFALPEEDLEIFADPLLERVFYNLVDNSIRHGEHVSTISIRCAKVPEGILILYEDNGVGVPVDMKEKIFDRGVGKHTGLGLFLAREILEITGLSIRENGVPGIGVRFEIHVPRSQYRIRS